MQKIKLSGGGEAPTYSYLHHAALDDCPPFSQAAGNYIVSILRTGPQIDGLISAL